MFDFHARDVKVSSFCGLFYFRRTFELNFSKIPAEKMQRADDLVL